MSNILLKEGTLLIEPLFNREKEVTKKEAVSRLNYFIDLAQQGIEMHKINKKESLAIAQRLRKELKIEHHNNDLTHVSSYYLKHDFFEIYKRYIHRAFVSITGNLSYEKTIHFLYDVTSYLGECEAYI